MRKKIAVRRISVFVAGLTRLLFLLLPTLTYSGQAVAAGFDCAHAATPTEIYICLDYRVSDLDSALHTLYNEAQQQAKDAIALGNAQKRWLAQRNRCTSPECLLKTYRSRIAELSPSHTLAKEPEATLPWDLAPPKSLQAKGLNIRRVIYTNPTGQRLIVSYTNKAHRELGFADFATGKFIAEKDVQWVPRVNEDPVAFVLKSTGEIFERADPDRVNGGALRSEEDADSPYLLGTHGLGAALPFTTFRRGFCHKHDFIGVHVQDKKVLVGFVDSPEGGCYEGDPTLPIDQYFFEYPVIIGSSLFSGWHPELHVIRFNEELYSGSPQIGRKAILAWESDLKSLIPDDLCNGDGECLLGRLARLIKRAQQSIH